MTLVAFGLIYFNNKPLHVPNRLAARHQEDRLCITSNCYSDGLLPANTTHDYTSCCLYRIGPPDDEQQAC